MTKFEVKSREEVRKYRMDEAIKKVENDERLRSTVFSQRLSESLRDRPVGFRTIIAKAIKSANSTITSWEYFTPRNFEKLAKLCKALDLDANYLLGLTEEKKTLSEMKDLYDIKDYCEHCGCNELLCGEGGVGCTSARANQ